MESLISSLNNFSFETDERKKLYESSARNLECFNYIVTYDRYMRYLYGLEDLEKDLPEIYSLLCQFINTTGYDTEYYYYLSKIIDYKLIFILHISNNE